MKTKIAVFCVLVAFTSLAFAATPAFYGAPHFNESDIDYQKQTTVCAKVTNVGDSGEIQVYPVSFVNALSPSSSSANINAGETEEVCFTYLGQSQALDCGTLTACGISQFQPAQCVTSAQACVMVEAPNVGGKENEVLLISIGVVLLLVGVGIGFYLSKKGKGKKTK